MAKANEKAKATQNESERSAQEAKGNEEDEAINDDNSQGAEESESPLRLNPANFKTDL